MISMSNGWLKELILDYGLNRLSIDQKSDLSNAISTLYTSGIFAYTDLRILNDYVSGYTAPEIALRHMTTTDVIENILNRMFTAISTVSGYTDERFIESFARQYPITRKQKLAEFLLKHGQRFFTHDI